MRKWRKWYNFFWSQNARQSENDIGTKTCEVDNVFSPDDLWFGSNTYTNWAVLYNLYLDVKMMGYVICI